MKTKHLIFVMTLLFFAASPCFAAMAVEFVPKYRAKSDFGVTIRTAIVGTNQAGVWLEFVPEGKLATCDSALLWIKAGDRTLEQRNLMPLKQTAERVVFYFATDPAYLPMSEVILSVKVGYGMQSYIGYEFNIGDFIKDDDFTNHPAGAMTNAPDFRVPLQSKFPFDMREFTQWNNSPFCITNAADYFNGGNAKQINGDLDRVIADYTKAIERDLKDSEAYFNRGNAKALKGDLAGTMADYAKAIELNPKYAAAYLNRGNVKSQIGDKDGAIADYSKVIELNPKYAAAAYANRGDVKARKGDQAGADADFAQAEKLRALRQPPAGSPPPAPPR